MKEFDKFLIPGSPRPHFHPAIAQLVERRTVESQLSLGHWFESGWLDFFLRFGFSLKMIVFDYILLVSGFECPGCAENGWISDSGTERTTTLRRREQKADDDE